MSIFYGDSSQPFTGKVNFARIDAVKKVLEHYGNYLILDAISKNPKSPAEKRQALKELTICERKMTYWKRMPTYDQAAATAGMQALKAQWR